jgi:hypothetical protein
MEKAQKNSVNSVQGMPYLAYSSILKMGAICSSETSEYFYRTASHHTSEDDTIQI